MHPSRRPRRPPWGCECYTHNANVLLLLSTCSIELLLGCTPVWRVLSQMFCNRRWPAACSGLSHSVVHLPVIPMQLHDEASYYHVFRLYPTTIHHVFLYLLFVSQVTDLRTLQQFCETQMRTSHTCKQKEETLPTRCRNGAKEAHLLVCICNYCFWGIYLGKLAQQGYEQFKESLSDEILCTNVETIGAFINDRVAGKYTYQLFSNKECFYICFIFFSIQPSTKWVWGYRWHSFSLSWYDLMVSLSCPWSLMTLSRAAPCCAPWQKHFRCTTRAGTESSVSYEDFMAMTISNKPN